MRTLALFLMALAACLPAHAGSDQEATAKALRALCPIGMRAGGTWGDDDINAAIATIGFGSTWPDSAQATAYKLCSYGGYLD